MKTIKKDEKNLKPQEKAETGASKSKNLRISFATIEEARESLARLTIGYIDGVVSEHSLRAATYSINGIGKLLLHEKIEKLERRMAVLEKSKKG